MSDHATLGADLEALGRRVAVLETDQLRAEVVALCNRMAALQADVSSNSDRGFLK